MRELADRILVLQEQHRALTTRMRRITTDLAPELVAKPGVSPDTATTLLITAGDNPDRLSHEKSFAALAPVEIRKTSTQSLRHHSVAKTPPRRALPGGPRLVIRVRRHHPDHGIRRRPGRTDLGAGREVRGARDRHVGAGADRPPKARLRRAEALLATSSRRSLSDPFPGFSRSAQSMRPHSGRPPPELPGSR
jgi:hypothetical protein